MNSFERWKNRKLIKEILEDKIISEHFKNKVILLLENRKVTLDRMKNIALWVKYDIEDNYLDRFDKLLKHPRNDSSSKEIYILRYGEKEGLRRFEEKSKSCSQTEKNMIKRYGKKEGLKKWEVYKNKISFSNSEEGYINRYGNEEGKKKFKKQAERNSGNLTLERKIELFGEEVGLEEFNKMKITLKERNSLKNYIRLFGEEEGTYKYINLCKVRSYKNSLSYYVEKYGEEEGIKKITEVKNTSTLEAYQKRYGKEEGYIEYVKNNKKKLHTKENFIERHGAQEGLKRWEQFEKQLLKGYSNISIELFESLEKTDAAYGENEKIISLTNEEYDVVSQSIIKPDFILGTKIIEFYGDFWHGNPNIYDYDYLIPNINRFASEQRIHDKVRINILKNKGYDVKIVWEQDYINNKEKVKLECLEFLNE